MGFLPTDINYDCEKFRSKNQTRAGDMMIAIYCRSKHRHVSEKQSNSQLCDECADLLQYAHKRLSMCRFGEQKTTCKRCPKHCYRSDYKARVKEVMRFAGPRMLIYHPTKALLHMYKTLIRR
ncbi:nitrous oxide-stimulated promoter family protein [Orbaceae bacterium ESL0721]|nr:nitrous oxide-stimulated promoter family protein [Orbaceae bacterium ESL0721]